MTEQMPMSVVHFTGAQARGGAEEHMLGLLRRLDRDLFTPVLVCPPALLEQLQPDLPRDINAVPVNLRRANDLVGRIQLFQLLRSMRVDVFHSHLFFSSFLASPVARMAGARAIIETPHVREHWRKGWSGSYSADRFISRFVDLYIAVSIANANYLVDEKRLPRRKVVTIQNGCDIAVPQTDQRAIETLRQECGFHPTSSVIVMLGRLEPQKGHAVLLDAMVSVHREFPELRLVCIGEGSLLTELLEKRDALGLADSIRFVGQRSDVPAWLALSDFSVLPSFYEGLPLAAMESLAAGKPVVATEVDGTPEVVLHGRTGLLVPPGNSRSLSAGICQLLRDPALCRTFGENGRRYVSDHFSIERQVRSTEDLYLRACGSMRPAVLRTEDALL